MQQDSVKYEEYKLLTLLASDSEYAFQLLYDRHRNRIYQVAIQYLKSPLLGQEVVQDVFLKLWFERKNLSPDKPIEAWLFVVARNNILNRLKKLANEWKAIDQLTRLFANQQGPAFEKAESDEYAILLQKAIAALPDQQQKVFRLAREEKLAYWQIAARMNISPLTVKTHMARALQQIRKFLKTHGVDIPVLVLFLLGFFF